MRARATAENGSRAGRLAAVGLAAACLAGCAGGQVYENGINHVYLCTVRVVRDHGYQVRQQDFRESKGKLVAARSTPDPLETPVKRGFFRRAAEVAGNLLEHGKLEFYDDYLAGNRIRTDKRVVAAFKSCGFLGWRSGKRTRVKLSMDVTDYGREDWVIKRERFSREASGAVYASLGECLTAPGRAGRPRAAQQPVTVSAEPAPPAGGAQAEEAPPAASLPAAGLKKETEPAPKALTVEEIEATIAQGRAAYEKGDFRKTLELLELVIAIDASNAEALGYLGAACYQTGRKDDAIRMYERYIAVVPSDARTREFLERLKSETP